VAPYVRDDVHHLLLDHQRTAERVFELEHLIAETRTQLAQSLERLERVETHLPTLLNAISSVNGFARLSMREIGELRSLVAAQAETAADAGKRADELRADLLPHLDTIAYLVRRVETVRAEMLNELRYGTDNKQSIETKVVNEAALRRSELRLNLGAGHITFDDYVNVDLRELPGIDVVAPVDALPFETASIAEIFSSHVLEHFPELELRRKLLPYWYSLLKVGGTFRAIVPDLEAMTMAYAKGEIAFETLRSVMYGGQEYELDFHLTGFTPDSLETLFTEAGFRDVRVLAKGRPNGDCLEFEIAATRSA
jgi:hypothetical protein